MSVKKWPPRWYRRYVTISLYKLDKKIPPILRLVFFLFPLPFLPFLLFIKVSLHGYKRSLIEHFISSPSHEPEYLLLAALVLAWSGSFMFFVNASYVSYRRLLGLPARKKGSVYSWLYHTVKDTVLNRLPRNKGRTESE